MRPPLQGGEDGDDRNRDFEDDGDGQQRLAISFALLKRLLDALGLGELLHDHVALQAR